MSTHAPTPWTVDEVRTDVGRAFRIGTGEMLKAGKGCCIIYDDYPGQPDNERKANATFIVEACNSHDYLITQVAELRAVLQHIRDRPGECPADHPKWLAKIDALLGNAPVSE